MFVKYPEVKVELVGQDGNAFSIMGRVDEAMRKFGLDKSIRNKFMQEAMAGDYDHLLRTCMEWVDCDGVYNEGD